MITRKVIFVKGKNHEIHKLKNVRKPAFYLIHVSPDPWAASLMLAINGD